MSFKDVIANDINNIFFNADEFGENHVLGKDSILCIIDNDRLKERSKKEYDGISVGELLLFAKTSDINMNLRQDMPIVFDGRQMKIFDIREDMGVYEIILSQNLG